MSRIYDGRVSVTNDWGVDLASLTVRHRRGNNPDKQDETTWYNIPSGGKVSGMHIVFETGAFSPRDYWWVSFLTVGNQTYTCKDSFYCSVSSSDTEDIPLVLDGASQQLKVSFSRSGGCTVSVSRVG